MPPVKRFCLAMAGVLSLAVAGCISDSGGKTTASGNLTVTVVLDKVGALAKAGKASGIVMSKLYLTASANGGGTLSDTVTLAQGNDGYSVQRTFSGLAADKPWRVSAVTRDIAGVAIHSADTILVVAPRTTHMVNLVLPARYSTLKARFFPIVDSVTRLHMRVDDNLVASAAFAKQSRLGDSVVLAHDYVSASPTGVPHSIRLDAYGDMGGDEHLLYRGDTTVMAISGQEARYMVTLRWVGPSAPPPGQGEMYVVLGALGTVWIDAELQDTTASP